MAELAANLGEMVRSSWRADRLRSVGAMATTALVPVTRPLRAIGLGAMADGIVAGDRGRVLVGVGVTAGLTAANRLLDWASLTIRMRLREHTVLFLDQRVMELSAGAPGLEHHERPDHQDHMELLRIDRGYLVNPFMPIAWTVAGVIQLVATMLVLAGLHPVIALLPLAGAPSLWAMVRVQRNLERLRQEQAERQRLMRHLLEVSTGAVAGKEVRVFGLADELVARYDDTYRRLERRTAAHNMRSGALMSAGWMCFAAGYMAAVAFVALGARDGRFTVGAIVITFSMGSQINAQLSELVQNLSWFGRTANAIGRYRWLQRYVLEADTVVQAGAPAPLPERITTGVVFAGVTFTYPGTNTPVISDVDLEIPAGTTVAIVGENGAGKTTLVKLLCRFYEPTDGTVTVDGIDIRRFDIGEWRTRMSAGFQDFARMQLEARESVGVGDLSVMDGNNMVDTAVMEALDRAAGADLVAGLPFGLDTQLGRDFDGVELSLGQWQKVALGRAFMRPEPLVLVLDEPTASLDAPTEHALFEQFAGAARRAAATNGAVTILVSHRFSTVRMADLIVVVGDGRILERGTHDELMALGGLYAELYSLQARAYA